MLDMLSKIISLAIVALFLFAFGSLAWTFFRSLQEGEFRPKAYALAFAKPFIVALGLALSLDLIAETGSARTEDTEYTAAQRARDSRGGAEYNARLDKELERCKTIDWSDGKEDRRAVSDCLYESID